MALKFQRYEAPPEGKTLLLSYHEAWKDPRKQEGQFQEILESQKGIAMPTWTQLIMGATVVCAMGVFKHKRSQLKWKDIF